MAARRCKNCGRKVVWDEGTDWWPAGWVHKKTNLAHCPYTDNMIEPYEEI